MIKYTKAMFIRDVFYGYITYELYIVTSFLIFKE